MRAGWVIGAGLAAVWLGVGCRGESPSGGVEPEDRDYATPGDSDITGSSGDGDGVGGDAGSGGDTHFAPGVVDALHSDLTVSPPSLVADDSVSATITIVLRDGGDAPISGVTPVVVVGGTGNALVQPGPTDGTGTTSATLRSTVAEVKSLGATAAGVSLADHPTVRFVAGDAARLVIVDQPIDTTADADLATITVRIEDAFGNLVDDDTTDVSVDLLGPPASGLYGQATVTAQNGVATFAGLSITLAGDAYVLVVSAGTLLDATSDSFDVDPGRAAKLGWVSPPVTTTSMVTMATVTVAILDAHDNLVSSSAAVALAIEANPPGDGRLSGGAAMPAVQGRADFSALTVDRAGQNYTLEATSPGLSPVTSPPFDIDVGDPAALAFATQPVSMVFDHTITPAVVVDVIDAGGNVVTGATDTVVLAIGNNAGGGALGGTLSVDAVAGHATFDGLSIDQIGDGYTLAATAAGLAGDESDAFDITAIQATRLAFAIQPGNTVSMVQMANVRVALLDPDDNVFPGSSLVTLSIGNNAGPGGVLSGTLSRNAVAGYADFGDLAIDKIGTGYTLTASANGLVGDGSDPFNITIGAPDGLVFFQKPANTAANANIAPSPIVRIVDAGGNFVSTASASLTIAILANPGSGTLAGTTTVATTGGQATFSTLQIQAAGAGYKLRAYAPGLLPAVSDAFDIVPGPALNRLRFLDERDQSLATGTVFPGTVGVTLEPIRVGFVDNYGNVDTSKALVVALAINCTRGVDCSYTTQRTAVNGIATFDDIRVDVAGTPAIQATATFGVPFVQHPTPAATLDIYNPGAPAFLQFNTVPTDIGVLRDITPAITVSIVDSTFHVVTTATSDVTLSLSPSSPVGGSLVGDLTVAAVNGVATFTGLQVDMAGNYYLRADSSGVPQANWYAAMRARRVRSIVSGYDGGCALIEGGDVKCWGGNLYGSVGNGSGVPEPTPVTVLTGATALYGGGYSHCATITDGSARCWGKNDHGQLGDRTTTNRPTPVLSVNAGFPVFWLVMGLDHSCAMYNPFPSKVMCWGSNEHGQLGNGNQPASSLTPVQVLDGATAATTAYSIAAGRAHSCAVTNGFVKCWGDDPNGGDAPSPVNITGFGFTPGSGGYVAATYDHTCYVSGGGKACWGANGDGQSVFPGNLNTTNISILAPGKNFTCSLTLGGVACWGNNLDGQLGDETLTSRPTSSAAVHDINGFALGLSAGEKGVCVWKADETVECWGYNAGGQVGDGTTVSPRTKAEMVIELP